MKMIKKSQPFHNVYKTSLALLTDLYQLTMAYGYWKMGIDKKESVFHHFFRRAPFHGGFTVAAGLENFSDFIESFRYHDDDLSYLSNLNDSEGNPYFPQEFLNYLQKLKFSCDIDAVPEGTIVFPYEPLIRVTGPLLQCQLLESPLLNLINFPTLIATKAARICIAAKGDSVMEFGMRRAQGIDGALTASRSAYIGGCDSTSNVLAGKLFNIPVKGTHSHSWIMVFDDELEAFQAFAMAMPGNTIFLVDTYDTIEGVKKAIQVGKWLKEQGKTMMGIRLDSGDLADLSIKSRKLLDDAGFKDAKIIASNELDENIIRELKRQGAQIGVWGVGTHLVTGKEQPALDGVYKLSAVKDDNGMWKYKLKLSEQLVKVSNPGILQVKRFYTENGNATDMVYDIYSSPSQDPWTMIDPLDPTKQKTVKKGILSKDLLVPIFRKGERVYSLPTLEQIQKNTKENLDQFDVGIKRFINPQQYFVGMEKNLYQIKANLIQEIRDHTSSSSTV